MKESSSGASGRGALAEFKEAVTNLFDQVVGLAPDLKFRRDYPKHELRIEDDGYVAVVEIPGLRRDEVEVSISGRALSISGERARFNPPTEARLLRSERPSGEFSLAIRLPAEVDTMAVVARVRDGMLEITLPKPTDGHGRNIEVDGAEDAQVKMPWEEGSKDS